ncbi:MAG TPA: bifunctional copper resistance protein CopD/cytochrome c oxidase assembly protein [Intrasporangium sp.]|uniref:bifunctional copper resistance protein CopD/cytochrome c oxidase assembly protein n=1 Tax=Intrasporangium sp. TaxID=1925024 RepID=UPI002B46D760|nr:bifunctional copper resistance protein CopD/cytochrome c oxidase assembly protein [Intrasporangium sp.]HKX69518.1 bifunctional copper resistance protein CopD/cytochrome c oxidase assembly protein [Intrasporangium sp.]
MPSPARHVAAVRSPGPWAVALVVLAGLGASVLAAGFSGAVAAPMGGLSDAGPVVRWALPLVRVVHDVAAALTVGTLVLAATMIPGATRQASVALEEPRRAAALRVATASAFVWAVAGVVVVLFTFADASGLSLDHPLFARELLASVWAIDTLRIGLISAMAAFVVASGAAVARARSVAVALSVVALLGIAVLGLAGHAGGSADHETAVNAMAGHLLSATLWTGGLLGLIVLRPRLGDALPVLVRRYSAVALWAFIGLGTSGALAASTRFARVADLTTSYGILVVLKAAALVLLGFAGWWHRRSTIDALERRGASGSATGRPFLRLAVGEVVLMGLAFGLATALARTAPPVPETLPNPSPALALTDFPEPPAPTALSWVTAWRVDWLFLAVALLAIGLYVAGVVRLARRGDRWPVLRTVNWVLGWLVFIWATGGVLGIYGRVAFSWHMTLHMIEAMVVPILLVLGAPVTLALRTLRPRADGTLGPRELLLGLIHSPYLKVVGNPIFAAAFFFMSLVAFYWTGLFELALTTHTGHLVMTAHFLVAGYLFAWVLVGVDPGPPKWSPALRLIVLFATIAFHAFFGVSIMSGNTLLAPDFFTTINVSWIDDPLADQRNGGAIAWAIGELPAVLLALLVATQWFRADKAEGRRRDRRADRDGDAELAAYNEHLAQLAQRDRTNQP